MKPMLYFKLRFWLVAMIFGVTGCVVQPREQHQPPAVRPIGTLDFITGPNAYYEQGSAGGAVRARVGQRVFEGDRIFTGSATHMTLRFDQGGYAELDENTDPVPRFLQDFGCLIVDLLHTGRMFVDASQACVGSQGVITAQSSQVVYDVRSGPLQITVAGGRAEVRRPWRVAIPAGHRLDANAKQMPPPRAYPLTRAQVLEAVQWTRWYRQTRPVLPGTTAPPPIR